MDEIKKKNKRKRKAYTGVTRRSNHSFLISYYDGSGKRIRETVHANSEKEAFDIRECRRLGVERKEKGTLKIGFRAYITNFIQELKDDNRPPDSIRKYRERYERLEQFINENYEGVKYISDITTEHIRGYKTHRLRQGYNHNGINEELTIIRRLFNKAKEAGIIKINPARSVEFFPEEPIDHDFLRENELERIFETLKKNKKKPYYQYRYLYEFLYYLPWRKMEMANLKRTDYNPYDKSIRHYISKRGGDIRYVKLSEDTAGILEKQLEHLKRRGIESEYIFPTITGKRYHRNHIRGYLKQAANDAGIEKNITVHMLRRSYVSNAHQKGYSLEQIAKMTGHRGTKTLREHYAIIPESTQIEMQDKMYIGKKVTKK